MGLAITSAKCHWMVALVPRRHFCVTALVACNREIESVWPAKRRDSGVAAPRHSHRYGCVAAPCSHTSLPGHTNFRFLCYRPLVWLGTELNQSFLGADKSALLIEWRFPENDCHPGQRERSRHDKILRVAREDRKSWGDARYRLPSYRIVTQCKSSTLFGRCTTITFLREAQGIICRCSGMRCTSSCMIFTVRLIIS